MEHLVEINDSNTSAKLMISHEEWGDGKEGVWDQDLLVREALSEGDFNLYVKKDARIKV